MRERNVRTIRATKVCNNTVFGMREDELLLAQLTITLGNLMVCNSDIINLKTKYGKGNQTEMSAEATLINPAYLDYLESRIAHLEEENELQKQYISLLEEETDECENELIFRDTMAALEKMCSEAREDYILELHEDAEVTKLVIEDLRDINEELHARLTMSENELIKLISEIIDLQIKLARK